MWAQKEKVQILAAIQVSLPTITKEASLLWAAGVPDLGAAIISGVATSSLGKPGTSTVGITPQGA